MNQPKWMNLHSSIKPAINNLGRINRFRSLLISTGQMNAFLSYKNGDSDISYTSQMAYMAIDSYVERNFWRAFSLASKSVNYIDQYGNNLSNNEAILILIVYFYAGKKLLGNPNLLQENNAKADTICKDLRNILIKIASLSLPKCSFFSMK